MFDKFAFLLTTDAELPLHVELWNYFVSVYVYNDAAYENLNFGGLFSPQTLVIGLFLGLVAACFAVVFTKKTNGALVHKLLEEGCVTPESAKSLPELDLADKLLLRIGVKRGALLRSVVRCKEEEEYILRVEADAAASDKPKRKNKYAAVKFAVNPDEHHFYIPDENRDAAAVKFREKGSSWGAAVLYAAILLTALCVFIALLPFMLGILDDFVGMLK